MNITEFEDWADKKNDKWVKELWTYFEDFIYVDYRKWKHKIDFLDKFVKVLWDYWIWDCMVDEVIWFINDTETTYIWEDFLDICIKNKILGEDSRNYYHFVLENSMWDKIMSYEEWIKLFTKK